MDSWVRYSVAVYTGLLLAGAAGLPREAEFERAASATSTVRKAIILPRPLQDAGELSPDLDAAAPSPINPRPGMNDTL